MKKYFDSHEEKYINWYVQSLVNHGFIKQYIFHHKSYELSNKVTYDWTKPMKRVPDKTMETTILLPHTYTPDILINWSQAAEGIFYQNLEDNKKITAPFIAQENQSIWEIKGNFDYQNMTRLAMLNIKWVMKEYGDFIQIVSPQKIFNKTFTPERYLFTDKSFKPRKLKYKNVRTIREFRDKIS
jgi:hypothetical protein